MSKHNSKTKLYLILGIASLLLVTGVAFQSEISVTEVNADYNFEEDQESGEWQVTFSTQEPTEITFLLDDEYENSLELYKVQTHEGQWIDREFEQTGNEITIDKENPGLTRIRYNITEFDEYSGSLQTTESEQELSIETNSSIEQTSNRLSLGEMTIELELCGFAEDFWVCSPEEGQPGYEGEVIDTDQTERLLELPQDSEVQDFSLKLESVENDTVISPITGEVFETGNLETDEDRTDLEEIITFEGSTLQVYNQQGDLEWTFETENDINQIISDSISPEDEEGTRTEEENILVSTENALLLLDYEQQEIIWEETGREYESIGSGEITTDQELRQKDDGEPNQAACIGCEDQEAQFELPYEVNESKQLFFLDIALNYIENPQGQLELQIGDSTYPLETSEMENDNIEQIRPDSDTIDQIVDLSRTDVTLDVPQEDLNANQEYLQLPLAIEESIQSNEEIEIQLDDEQKILETDDIAQEIDRQIENTYDNLNSLISLDDPVTYELDFNIQDETSNYLRVPINKKKGEDNGQITITISDETYTIDSSRIETNNVEEFGEDDENPQEGQIVDEDNTLEFDLFYDIPEDLEAEELFLRTAISKFDQPQGELTLNFAGQEETISPEEIDTESERIYSINDDSANDQVCIECEDEENEGLIPEFNLDDAFGVENFGESANVDIKMCQNGEGGEIALGGDLDSTYTFTPDAPDCDQDGYGWVSTSIDQPEDLGGLMTIQCEDCSDENNIQIALDSSTDGGPSQALNQTNGQTITGSELGGDFMINVTTDQSFEFEFIDIEVDPDEVETGETATFTCEGCDEGSYRMMLDDSTSGNTRINDQELEKDLIARIWTNSSLEHDEVQTRVDTEELQQADELQIECAGCNEGYNILSDDSNSGNTIQETETLDREAAIDIISKPTATEFIDIEIDERPEEVTLSCEEPECSEKVFLGLDSQSDLESIKEFGGSTARIWSNESLEFDLIRTEVDQEDLENNNEATIACEDCSDSAYNIMVDGTSDLDSEIITEEGEEQMDGGFIVRQETFGSNFGKEIVTSTPQSQLQVFNSTGSEIWSETAINRANDIEIDEVTDDPSNQVIIGTRDGIEIYSATGELLEDYETEIGDQWITSVETANINTQNNLNEIIVGTQDGTIYTLNQAEIEWTQDYESEIIGIETGEIIKEESQAIAVAFENGQVKILDFDGQEIIDYPETTELTDIGIAEVTERPGQELGISDSNEVSFFNLYDLPEDLEVEINDEQVLQDAGIFRGTEIIDDESQLLNDQLEDCSQEPCITDINFHSTDTGQIRIRQPEIIFEYDLEDEIDVEDEVVEWAETRNVEAGQNIPYGALELSYLATPSLPINIGRISSAPIQTALEDTDNVLFNQFEIQADQTSEYIDLANENLPINLFPESPRTEDDLIWYNSDLEEPPIEIQSTSDGFETEGSEAEKTFDLTRTTEQIDRTGLQRTSNLEEEEFHNVTTEINFDEEVVKADHQIFVQWKDDRFESISPDTLGCENYEKTELGQEETFYTCFEDTTGSNLPDQAQIIQPLVGEEGSETAQTSYKVNGTSNPRPEIVSLDVNPEEDHWGQEHQVQVEYENEEDDSIETRIWVEEEEGWEKQEETDIINSADETAQIEFTTTEDMLGETDIKVEYVDLDEDGEIRPRINSTEIEEPKVETIEVSERPSNIEITDPGSSEIDRIDEDNLIEARVTDEITDNPIENEFCFLTIEGQNEDVDTTDAQGDCQLELENLDEYDLGENDWKVEISNSQLYQDSETEIQTIELIGNLQYDIDPFEDTAFLENVYDGVPEEALYRIENIRDLTDQERNIDESDISIELNQTSYPEGPDEDGVGFQGEIRPDIFDRDDADIQPGETEVQFTLEKEGFNDAVEQRNFTIRDSFESILATSETTIDQSETVTLEAEFETDRGSSTESVNPEEVEFDVEAEGFCESQDLEGSTVTCEFSPGPNVPSGTYDWQVEAEKDFHTHIQNQDNFEISGDINAEIEIEEDQLHRNPDSTEGTNILTYSIEDVEDEEGDPINDVDYRLEIEDGEEFTELQSGETGSDSNEATETYEIDEQKEVGSKNFRVVVETEEDFISANKNIDIVGTLEAETQPTDHVYIPTTETLTDSSFETETQLNIEVTDEFDDTLTGFDTQFDIPEGSCVDEDEGQCTFEPSSNIDAGDYTWSANIDKEFYESVETQEENFVIRDVVTVELPSGDEGVIESSFDEEATQNFFLENSRGDRIDTEGDFEVEVDGNTAQFDAEDAQLEWTTTCNEYDQGEQTLTANLNEDQPNEFYSIFDGSLDLTLQITNSLDVDILSPADIDDEDAQSFTQGDTVSLETEVTGDCGGDTSNFEDDILWTAEMTETGDQDTIGSGSESSWTIQDEFSGITEISAEVEGEFLEESSESVEIAIEEVITLNMTEVEEEITREIDNQDSWSGDYEAAIYTGQEELASDSEISDSEDWTNFRVTWYIEGQEIDDATTDDQGIANFEVEYNDQFDPGEVDLEVELEAIDEEELSNTLIAPQETNQVTLIDESETNILEAPDEVFYQDEVDLEMDFNTATDNTENIAPSTEWRYEREEDDTSLSISSDQETEWAISSSVYGEGDIVVTTDHEFLTESQENQELIGKREANIEEWSPQTDIPNDETSEFDATIEIGGYDRGQYEVTFEAETEDGRQEIDTGEIDSEGEVTLEWDTNDWDEGFYNTYLLIEDDDDLFIEAGENNEIQQEIAIAADAEVTEHFRGNLESVPGTRDEDNIRGDRYDDLPEYVVYRNAGPWEHPTEMYLGANITAPQATDDGREIVDDSVAEFIIEHDETGDTHEVATCEVDRENPEQVEENFFGFYSCETVWDASETGDLDVGSYTMTIDIQPPSDEWSVSQETDIDIEVRGQLEVEISQPDGTVPVYEMGSNNNISLEGTVTDLEGNTYDESQLDNVRWELGDSFSLSGTTRDITWSDHDHGGRDQLDTWVNLFNPRTSWRIRSSEEYAFLLAEKEYFEPTLNQNRRGWRHSGGPTNRRNAFRLWFDEDERGETTGSPDFESYVNNFGVRRFSYRVPLDLRLGFPEDITDTDEDDNFLIRADSYRTGTETTYTRFRGNYELECLNCTSETQTQTQSASSNLGRETAEWEFDFSDEEYNEYYEFEIRATSSNTGEITDTDDATVNEVIRVVRDLGAGEGDCEGSADDPQSGENVDVCPNEYGFEDLPSDYWLNETADNLRDDFEEKEFPETPPEDFDEFMNDEIGEDFSDYDIRWLQYQQFENESTQDMDGPYYEEDIRWYGEHSFYDDLDAGGCDFDGDTAGEDDFFESRSHCTDFILTAEPPEFEDIDVNQEFYRGQDDEPEINFDVEVDYPTADHFEFRITTPNREDEIIDPDEEGDYPHKYDFDVDPSAKTGNFDVEMEAITEELETSEETQSIYEDDQPAEITDIDVPSGLLNPDDTVDITAEINHGVTDEVIEDAYIVTADPGGSDNDVQMSYSQADNEWSASVSPVAEDNAEMEVNVEHNSGYNDVADAESYDVSTADPEVDSITDNTDDEPYREGDTIEFDIDFSDDDGALEEWWLEAEGQEKCSGTGISGGGDDATCDLDVESGWDDDRFTFTVYVEDESGREGQNSINLEIDNTDPDVDIQPRSDEADEEDVIAILSPDDDNVEITAEVNDDNDNLETVEFRENDEDGPEFCTLDSTQNGDEFTCNADYTDTNQLHVIGIDEAGNEGQDDGQIAVVENDPDVTITMPSDGEVLRDSLDVEADITDEDGEDNEFLDEDTFEYSIDGVTRDLDDSLDTEAEVSDGTHTLEVTAEDLGGNEGSDDIEITVDNSKPSIEFDSLSEDQIIDGTFTFEHTITNDVEDSDINEATYDIIGQSPGGDLDSNDDVQIDTEQNLGEGDHTIEIEATDEAGNSVTRTRDFNVNNEPPEIELESPDDLETQFYNDEIVLEVDIDDQAGNDAPEEYRCEISGEGVEDNSPENTGGTNYECTLDLSGLDSDDYTLVVEAEDTQGRTNDEEYSVSVDTDEPDISNIQIPDSDDEIVQPGTEITVQADVTDGGGGSGLAEVEANDQTLSNGATWDGDIDAPDEPDGTYDIQVFAEDEAGNDDTESAEDIIEIDGTDPEVNNFDSDATENEDGEGVATSGEELEFTVDATDENDNLDKVWIEDSSGNELEVFEEDIGGESGGEYTLERTPDELGLSAGENELIARAEDLAGNNEEQDTYTINIEDEDPDIEDIFVEGQDVVRSGTQITVTAQISDRWLDNVEFEHEGETISVDDEEIEQDDESTQTFSVDITSEGDHQDQVDVTVSAEDLAGNDAEDSTSYEINDEDPDILEELEVESTDEVISQSDDTLSFEIEATDDFEVDRVELGDENLLMNEDGQTYTLDETPDEIGCDSNVDFEDCQVSAQVFDNAGNDATSREVTINVDDVDPTVTDFTVDEDIVKTGEDVTFDVTITDGDPDIEVTEIRDSNNNQVCSLENGDEYDCTTSFQDEGTYNVNVYAEDRAGNFNEEETLEVTVTDSEPNIDNIEDFANERPDGMGVSRSDELLRIEATITDPDDLLVEDTVEIEGQSMSREEDTNTFYIEEEPSNLGCTETNHDECTLQITAEDEAGNEGTNSHNIIVDDEPAIVEDVEIEGEVFESGDSTDVTVELENDQGEDTVEYVEVEPSVNDDNNLTWTGTAWEGEIDLETTQSSESIENLEVRSVDYASNTNTNEDESYILDEEDPEITAFGSDDTTQNDEGQDITRSDEELTFDITVEDNVDIEKIEIGKQGQFETVEDNFSEENPDTDDRGPEVQTIDISPEDLGCTDTDFDTCVLTARVTDLAGNTGEGTYEIIIDDEDPTIDDIELSDTIVQSNTEVDITVDTSEEAEERIELIETRGDAEEIFLEWNEENNNWTGTLELDDVEGQDRELEVFAQDWAENTNTETKQYTVDDTPPEIDDLRTDSENDIERSDEELQFLVEANNQFEPVELVEVEGLEMTLEAGETFTREQTTPSEVGCEPLDDEFDVEDPTEADCLINATAIDQAGNLNWVTYEIRIMDEPPRIEQPEEFEDDPDRNYELEGVIEGDPFDSTLPYEPLELFIETTNPLSETNADLTAVNRSNQFVKGGPTSLNETDDDDNYELDFTTADLNATSSVIDFTVNITDRAGNTAEGIYTLDLDTVPPDIQEVNVNNTQPETTRDTVEIKPFVSHPFNIKEGMENSYINITGQNTDFHTQLNIENIEDERESEDINSGNFTAEFVPPETDTYNVTVFVEDEFDEPEDLEFESVFSSVGETEIQVQMAPGFQQFQGITAENPGQYELITTIENIGEATAYGTTALPSNTVGGINSNVTDVDCGDLEPGETCTAVSQINVTAQADVGINPISSNAFWDDADRTDGDAGDSATVDIQPNPILEVTSETHEEEIIRGETGELEIELFNRGNIPLEDIETQGDTFGGEILEEEHWIPPQISLIQEGERNNVTIQLTEELEDKGEYLTTFEFNAEENNDLCGENCNDLADTNITVFHEASVEIQQLDDQQLYRDTGTTKDITAQVLDDIDEPIENYNVSLEVQQFEGEEAAIDYEEELDTDTNGEIEEIFDLREDGFEPGEYNFITEINENLTRFYRTDQRQDSISLEVRDELDLDVNMISSETFWYTDEDDYEEDGFSQIVTEYYITDMTGEPVEGATVNMESNATSQDSGFEQVEDCTTDSSGECIIEYDPDIGSDAFAQIRSDVEKNEYYDEPATITNDIDILGDFSVVINSPAEDQNLLRGNEYDLEAAVLNDAGDRIDTTQESININWSIQNEAEEMIKDEEFPDDNETTWDIPADQSTEDYTIFIEVEDDDEDQPPVEDQVNVGVFEPITLDNAEASPQNTERKDSEITFDLEITDSNGDLINTNTDACMLEVGTDQRDIAPAEGSNSDGNCELIWETNKDDDVGDNTATVELLETEDQDLIYAPNTETGQTEEEFTITLEEDVNLTLEEAPTEIFRFEDILFRANTTDAFDRQIDAVVNWNIINQGITIDENTNETIWDTSDTDIELGPDTLEVTAEKQDYNTATEERDIRIFDRAQHEFELEEEFTLGDQIEIEVNVSNINTEEPIEDHPVRLYKDGELWTEQEEGEIRTDTDGQASITWDTQDAELGTHNITAELTNSTDTWHNQTTGNITQEVFIGGELETEIEDISETTVFRDEYEDGPFETEIELLTTRETSNETEPANNTIIINGRDVGECEAGEDGECIFNWNPDNQTEIGELEGFVNTTSDNFFPTTSENFTIDVKTAAQPELQLLSEKEYNFSQSQGIPVNATVLESFTDRKIEEYDFTLGWGQREPLQQITLNEEDWETDTPEQVNTTETGLQINNTQATLEPPTEEGPLNEIDIIDVVTAKPEEETEWTLTLTTEENEQHQIQTNQTTAEKQIDNKTIEQIEIDTDGEVTLLELELATLELDQRRELMANKILGSESPAQANGDFTETEIQETLETEREATDEEPLGWYIDFEQTHSDAEISITEQGLFGTPAAEFNLTEVPENETATLVREYDGSEFDLGYGTDFEILEIWRNSPLNTTLTLNGDQCSTEYTVESSEWAPSQQNITDFSDCQEINYMEIQLENTLGDELENNVTLDQFRRYSPSNTTETGKKQIEWLPPGDGIYSFKLEIEESEFYETTEELDIQDIEITSEGAGLDPEADDEDDIPDDEGELESIEIVGTPQNETLGTNTFGEIPGLLIENLDQLSQTNVTVAISPDEQENPEILDIPVQKTLEPSEIKEIQLPYQTQETGTYSTTISVFETGQEEREDLIVNKTVDPVETELLELEAQHGTQNITENDTLNITAELLVDDTPVQEDVEWEVKIGPETCQNTNQNFTDPNWELSCEAPFIEQNPLEPNLEITAQHQGIEVRDNQTIGYKDILPPIVEDKNAFNIEQGENNQANLTAFDNDEIDDLDAELVHINETDGSDVTIKPDVEFNNLEDNFYQSEEFEVTTTDPEGDYDLIVNITDVNENTRTTRIPFSVHEFVNMTGEETSGTQFTFNRPGTEQTLKEFEINSPFQFDVQNRTYDLQITSPVDVVIPEDDQSATQQQEILLEETIIDQDIEDPIEVTDQGEVGEDVNFERPEGTTGYTFSSLSYDVQLNHTNLEVTLDYSEIGKSLDEIPEEDLRIYHCSSNEIQDCETNNWTELDTTIDTENSLATAQSPGSSSYIIERIDTDDGDDDQEEDSGQEQEDNGGAGPTGPAAGGETDDEEEEEGEDDQIEELLDELGLEEDAIDQILESLGLDDPSELEEMIEEEGMDEVLDELEGDIFEGEDPFRITPRIYHPVMERGESRAFFMEIVNNREEQTQIQFDVDGDLETLLEFQDNNLTIGPESSSLAEMIIDIPQDAETGSYEGEITAMHEEFNATSRHQVLVVEEGVGAIELDVEALTQTVQPDEELQYLIEVGDAEIDTPINASLEHFVRESETDETIEHFNETRVVDEGINIQREVDLEGHDLGNYYVQTILRGPENVTVTSSDTFTIGGIFWTPLRRNAAILILLTVLISVGGWKGYQYYWEKKEEDSRYVFPVDYSKLPETDEEDNYWVGKVAETDKEAFVDPDDLTTHAIVSGSTGSGKSVTASVIVEEALENDVPVVVFDPTAQWTGFVKELKDDNLFEHYNRFDLDETEDPHPYRGVIKEIDNGQPDIDFEELKNPGEITVFTLNQLTTEQFDDAVRQIIDQIFDKEWEESPELEMLIVFDEVHRLLEEYGGKGGYHALEKGAREFRKWGIGLMMCSQVTADFKQAISGNIMTEIQMQTKSMEDIDRVETKYGEEFAKRISSEDVGVGMIQNSNYNDGDPWFVDFRPTYHNPHKIPDKELEQYHNLTEELTKLKDKLTQMKEQGQDVRDKKLELQLAENKLKEGRFKMANMYINSLKDELGIE